MSGTKQSLSLIQRREQDEESRKLERNRAAFEAWLERKREERKRERAEMFEAQRRAEREWENRRGVGQKAFERWLKMKRAEDEVRKTQLSRERELGRLKREETRERRQRSQAAFDTWKQLKDAEFQTERELERRYRISTTYPRREPTPSLPGYCSVWSCDLDMAHHFVARVRRSASLDLSDYHTSFTAPHLHTSHTSPSHTHNITSSPKTAKT